MRLLFGLVLYGWVAMASAVEFLWDRPGTHKVINHSAQADLKIMWWNIQKGETNQYIASNRKISGVLDQNIMALLESPSAPEILVFGEYSDDAFNHSTLEKLKAYYPHKLDSYIPFNPDVNQAGIMLFSRYPIELVSKELMDYFPEKLEGDASAIKQFKTEWQEVERVWPRYYLVFKVTYNDKEVYLSPVHLLEPWSTLYQRYGGGSIAHILVRLKVVFTKDNPLMYQLERFRSKLERDFGKELDQKPLIVMGDFNLPRKIWFFETQPYKAIAPGLLDPFYESDTPTWPAPSSKEAELFPKDSYRLDLTFHSKCLKTSIASVPPLMGSDHFPVYFGVLSNIK